MTVRRLYRMARSPGFAADFVRLLAEATTARYSGGWGVAVAQMQQAAERIVATHLPSQSDPNG